MQDSFSSSYIVRVSLGLSPVGTPAISACQCCMCGAHIAASQLANKAAFSSGFTDDLSLVKRGKNQVVCGDCQALCTVEGLRNSGFGAFSVQGYLPFRKWADVAFALLNPPPAPFVMCYATAKSQHMAWRAPVNQSPDLFRVRVGLQDLQIRRQRLLEAPAVCQRVAEAIEGHKSSKPKKASLSVKKTLPNPFLMLAPDLKDPMQGRLNPHVLTLECAESPPYEKFHEDMQFLRTLSKGEVWALRFILTPNAGATSSD